MATAPLTYLSPETHLELERGAESRSEYIDGVMYPMSGGRRAHARLAVRLARLLGERLSGQRCDVFNSNMQVAISPTGPFLYPDVSVACGSIVNAGERDDLLPDPLLIIEVLSPSTESYDRGQKFAFYRQVKSLQEYVLVSAFEPRIETFLRDAAGSWNFVEFTGLDAVCGLRSIELELRLSEVYQGIVLDK